MSGAEKMETVSNRKYKQLRDYRDKVKSKWGSIKSSQYRLTSGESSAENTIKAIRRKVDELNAIEAPKFESTSDPLYNRSLKSVKGLIEKSHAALADLEFSKPLNPPGVISVVIPEPSTEKLVCTTDMSSSSSEVAAYMEDMFIFQGNQISAVYGQQKLLSLFAKIISE